MWFKAACTGIKLHTTMRNVPMSRHTNVLFKVFERVGMCHVDCSWCIQAAVGGEVVLMCLICLDEVQQEIERNANFEISNARIDKFEVFENF